MNRRALLMAPFGAAVLGGAAFLTMLFRMQGGKFDPRGVPSMLIGRPVPPFTLPGLDGDGFSDSDLARPGRPILVNFFASWCVPCVEEAPVLDRMRQDGMHIWGIAYKDKPEAISRYLARHGTPYERLAMDAPGRVAIDWGVTGVPETYLVDAEGIVRWRIAGPLTPETVEQELKPVIAMARA